MELIEILNHNYANKEILLIAFNQGQNQNQNLEINQRLTAGARIGLEIAGLDSSSSTECSGDRKRVVGKREERGRVPL
ncbi:hypothetical protein Vadar_023436 [Vaccinium darrowii]|uniref:Uncharacterized protein n=1 Tax=Vaccinium darrowii TaxID=229202 RepID=A0ACB7YYL1_9ERIC|nr:hypothetical protein Vadar_023436 [Vaccinium darrowii]